MQSLSMFFDAISYGSGFRLEQTELLSHSLRVNWLQKNLVVWIFKKRFGFALDLVPYDSITRVYRFIGLKFIGFYSPFLL